MFPKDFYPKTWDILHTSAANWSDNPSAAEREELKLFLIGLPALIPCQTCKSHIRQWNLKHNLDRVVSSKQQLFNFLLALHNNVNQRHGKPEWSFEKAAYYYGYY